MLSCCIHSATASSAAHQGFGPANSKRRGWKCMTGDIAPQNAYCGSVHVVSWRVIAMELSSWF